MQDLDRIDILLVDDRPENLIALEAVLSRPDYNLVKAKSGDDALRYLLENDPALILMDVQMPQLDGFETASIIKQSTRSRDIPIIFLTAINKDERYVHQGYQGGAVDYISKPFDSEILRAKVAVFADLFRKTQSLLRTEAALRIAERAERETKIRELELASLLRDQAQQQKYRDLVSDIHNAIVWSAEPNSMVFSFISQSAEEILGYPLTDWSQTNYFRTAAPTEDADKLDAAIQNLVFGRTTEVIIEHRCRSLNQSIKWFQTSLRLRRTGNGTLQELRGLSTDITVLKEAELQLTHEKMRSEMLNEASYILTQSMNPNEVLKSVCDWLVPRYADWCTIEQMVDSEIQLAHVCHFNDERRATFLNLRSAHSICVDNSEALCDAFRNGTSALVTDPHVLIYPHGVHESLDVNSGLVLPLIVQGKILGVMTLIRCQDKPFQTSDLHFAESLASRVALTFENANLYQQATEAIQVRDEFLSVASHELRTPLTALTLQIQLLLRNLKNGTTAQYDSNRVREMTQGTNRQLKRLCHLLDDLLDVTRISQGKLTLNAEAINLVDLVRETASRFTEQLERASCTLDIITPDAIHGTWDPIRIEQVISNLLGNAMKYGAGHPIKILLTEQDGRAIIKVKDEGIGISAADQKRIFDRFERAISAKEVSGLGLGLYIVSQILSAHQGHIRVESDLGKGSIFTVELPLDAQIPISAAPMTHDRLTSPSHLIH